MKPHICRRTALSWAAATLFAFATGCGREPQATIRVGINAWPGYEFLYLAQEKGFFRDEGLDVRVIEFNSLSDARRAYERGQIDIIGASVIEVLQAREQSPRSPQIVQVVDYSDGADVVLTRAGITNGATLRGKRIGVELGSLGVYILARCLEKHGLRLKDVTPVSADQMSMETMFHAGELDAIVTYPPTSMKLLKDKAVRTFFTSAEIPGEVLDVIAIEAELAKERPADIGKLLRAFRKAVDYTQKNPNEAHEIMARREGITAKEFAESLTEGIVLIPASGQSDYLRPGGKMSAVIDTANEVLRQTRQISGPDRRAQSFTDLFAAGDDSGK